MNQILRHEKSTDLELVFPLTDADGQPITGAGGLDTEKSQDGGAFSDCTNEMVEIGTTGFYVVTITAAELNFNTVVIRLQSSTVGIMPLSYEIHTFINPPITSGSAGIATIATTAVITTGSEVNTYTATHERDGTTHNISDAAGTTDAYYEFNIGSTGVPTTVTLFGRSTGNNDNLGVFGYNWGAVAWEQIGTILGINGSNNDDHTFSMYSTHVGTGVDSGKVRVRVFSAGLVSATLFVDQLYVSYAVVASPIGYQDGAIWIDTVNGTAGAVDNVNGVADLPVNNMADANTLLASLNFDRFVIAPGSTITLAVAQENQTFTGRNWVLALNGQSILGSYFEGAEVSGIASGIGTKQTFKSCHLNAMSHIKGTHLISCDLEGTQTVAEAGDYHVNRSQSGIAGTATPIWDFGGVIGTTNVNFRDYSGGIQLESMGDTGTDTVSLEGRGQLIEGTCTGGVVAVRGLFTVSGISNLTLSDDARIDTGQIKAEAAAVMTDANTELAAIPTTTGGLRALIQYCFEQFRNASTMNKTTGVETLMKEDGTTPLGTRTHTDDGTTWTKPEMS